MLEIPAVALTGYCEVADGVGLDPFEMLADWGISPEALNDPEHRLPAANVVDLLEASSVKSGQDGFAILMADRRNFASIGALSFLLQHVPTVRDIVRSLADHRRHLADIFRISLHEIQDTAFIRFDFPARYALPQILSASVAVVQSTIVGATGGRWRPSAIHFMFRAPAKQDLYRRFFGVPIEFESHFNGFSCSTESLCVPNPLANDAMVRNALRVLGLIPLPPEYEPLTGQVRRTIALLLPSGRASLAAVAAHLAMSVRALQRGLEREGQVFSSLLNDKKRVLAQRYLSSTQHSITAIAEMLGYSSISAFDRWFAGEFAVSPHFWRQVSHKDADIVQRPGP